MELAAVERSTPPGHTGGASATSACARAGADQRVAAPRRGCHAGGRCAGTPNGGDNGENLPRITGGRVSVDRAAGGRRDDAPYRSSTARGHHQRAAVTPNRELRG